MSKLRQRLGREEGFTLIELLIVIVIIGILLAIAVPSYLGFRDRSNQRAAEANVRAAIPSAEAYYSDNNNYLFNVDPPDCSTTATGAALLTECIDSGLELNTAVPVSSTAAGVLSVDTTDGDAYCLSSYVGDRWAYVVRPAVDPNAAEATGNVDDQLRGEVVAAGEGAPSADPCP